MTLFSPEACHYPLSVNAPHRLRFDPAADLRAWRQEAYATLTKLLGNMPARVSVNVCIEWEADTDLFHETRFLYSAEANVDVPAHLLIPKHGSAPYPVIICLQGHNSGMHISLGQSKFPGDEESLAGERDYAIQAVKQGFAALVIEQRAFGERRDLRSADFRHGIEHPCYHAAHVALLLGRTLLGERVWDVSCAIDALAHFPNLDLTRIATLGDSIGGAVAFYAACYDPRIAATMPAAFLSTFHEALVLHDHCPDHYLPGMLNEFELSDLAGLIAPRSLIAVHGRDDSAFPYSGTLTAYAEMEKIYAAFGTPKNCCLVTGDGAHRFFADLAWPEFHRVTGW
jgi:dienelactone hydrolase